MSTIQALTDASFADRIQQGKWVVNFTSNTCHPCHAVKAIMAHLSAEMPGVTFAELNAMDNPRTIITQQVSGYPTVIYYENGRPVDLLYGAKPAATYQAKAQALANRA